LRCWIWVASYIDWGYNHMSDDEDACCGVICIGAIIIGIIWWVVDTFGWVSAVSVISIIAVIIVTIYVCSEIYDEGAFIKFGIAWFIAVFVISLIIDLWLMGYGDRGAALFSLSLFLNLPGTCILIGLGAKRLKSAADSYMVRGQAKNIIYFGYFWFFFCFISSVIVSRDSPDPRGFFYVFLIFVTIPGTIAIIIIGIRLSKVIGEGLDVYGPTPPTVRYGSYSIDNINDVPEHAVCPYCSLNIRESFYKFNGVVRCPECGAFHHTDCFKYGCGNPACRFRKS
jgi:hypothetical protein